MSKKWIIEVVSALFIILFLYTALAKTFQISSTETVLKQTPIFSNYSLGIAWGIVIAEYIVVLLLFFSRTRKFGLYGALFLMSSFTIYIVCMLSFAPSLPCSCGGVISRMTWKQHLFFNAIFVLFSIAAIIISRRISIKTINQSK